MSLNATFVCFNPFRPTWLILLKRRPKAAETNLTGSPDGEQKVRLITFQIFASPFQTLSMGFLQDGQMN